MLAAHKKENYFNASPSEHTKKFNSTNISDRENECIYHLIHGKTSKMIGKTLGLSPRTVEAYLDSAKTKLGVFSKAELIAKSIAKWYQPKNPVE